MAFSLGVLPGASDLKLRLSKALLDVSGTLASIRSGALVQVWMPEHTHDGTIVLSCQGLPFAVAGVGDLLALFRCVSVRYRFSTDVMKPTLMGAIGRVYSTLEPEMSHNVQKYDKQIYLRVSEAQRCRVHSTLMVPIFGSDSRDTPLAVFELVQGDKDVTFPAVLSQLTTSLQNVNLFTTDLETTATAAGLRKWPMHIDMLPLCEHDGAVLGRLSPTGDEPRWMNSAYRMQDRVEEEAKEQASSSNVVTTEENPAPGTSKGDEARSRAGERPSSHSGAARLLAGNSTGRPFGQGGLGPLEVCSSAQLTTSSGPGSSRLPAGPATAPVNTGAAAAAPGTVSSSAAPGGKSEAVGTQGLGATAPGAVADGVGVGGHRQPGVGLLDIGNAQQLISWLAHQSASGSNALSQLRAVLEQQQQGSKMEQAGPIMLEQQAAGGAQPRPMDAEAASMGPPVGIMQPHLSASPHEGSILQPQAALEVATATATTTAAAAAAASMTVTADKQIKLVHSGSIQRMLGTAADPDDGDGEDISSGGEDDESDDDRPGSQRNNNRVGGGAGKRLRFEDLQAQFGLGLKEAANNLGICATTLKRACRRHGIKRWPRRQIAKLSKALNQMGYSGAPPPGLMQNVVVSAGTPSAQAAIKPKPVKKPDAVTLQHATQLLFQSQFGAAAAAAAAGGGMFTNMAGAGMVMGGQLQGIPQGLHGIYGIAGQGSQAGMFTGPFMGPVGAVMAQHGGTGPSGALGQGPHGLLGAMAGIGGGLGAAIQMQSMGSLGALQGGAISHMQPAALGLQLQGAGGLQLQGAGSAGLPMHTDMLHPLLAGGGFSMHQALRQQQQQQQQQLQQHLQAQQQQQASNLMQQQAHQQQHQVVLQQQVVQQQQLLGPGLQQLGSGAKQLGHGTQQLGAGVLQQMGKPEAVGWLGQVHGAAHASMGPGVSTSSAMDVNMPRVSCGEAHSPFSMSPAMSGATNELCGLAEIPEEFIQNLNSAGNSQFGQLLKSSGMELMDLLGDDIAAR